MAVDQLIDRTFAREKSFFGEGLVAHVSMAEPFDARLTRLAATAGERAARRWWRAGPYLGMEGPQFSTRAESELYRAWGAHVIGMTASPEAKLAREAELPYASIAMVTDYDCWRDEGEAVEVSHILEVLRANAAKGKALVQALARTLADTPRTPAPADTALEYAIVTAPEHRDPALVARLDAVAGAS